MGKAPQGLVIDHINGNRLDNRKKNLRFVTMQQNCFNSAKKRAGRTSSRYKGVHHRKERNKWVAYISIKRKKTFLGSFNTEIEAARAYNEAAKREYGEYARLNNIEGEE